MDLKEKLKFALKKIWEFLENSHALNICLLLALSSFLGLYQLDHRPFFENEGVSLFCSKQGLHLLHPGLYEIAGCGFDHVPLYYLLLKFWSQFVELSKYSARFLSVLFFPLAIICTYFWGELVTKNKAKAFSLALLTAFNFQLIQDAQYIRMYSLFFFSCMLTLVFFEKIKDQKKTRDLICFVALFPLGALNFLGYLPLHFLLTVYLLWHFKDYLKEKKTAFSLGASFLMYILLAVYKVPALFHWRYTVRTDQQQVFQIGFFRGHFFQDINNELLYPLFKGFPNFFSFDLPSLANSLPVFFFFFLAALLLKKSQNKIGVYLWICIIGLSTFFVLRYLIVIEEIKIRYFLYIIPMVYLVLIEKFKKGLPKLFIAILLIAYPFESNYKKAFYQNTYYEQEIDLALDYAYQLKQQGKAIAFLAENDWEYKYYFYPYYSLRYPSEMFPSVDLKKLKENTTILIVNDRNNKFYETLKKLTEQSGYGALRLLKEFKGKNYYKQAFYRLDKNH